MSASLKLRVGVVAAGLSCLLLGYAVAQQTSERLRGSTSNAAGQTDRSSATQSDQSTTPSSNQTYRETTQHRTANYRGAQTTAGGQDQAVERYLASCLLGKNQSEVQLSELAQQKSENPDVKQFAEEMIKDHRKMIEQLQPLAGMQASTTTGARSETERSTATETPNTRSSSESVGRPSESTTLPGSSATDRTIPPSGTTAAAPRLGTSETTTNVTANDRAVAGGGAIQQLGQIERQVGDRATQMTRDDLQQKSGADFDKAFVGCTISAHVHALAALEVIGQQTQGQLAQVAKQAQPTVQQHLDHAKQLMKQLEGQASASGSQAERKSSTRTE